MSIDKRPPPRADPADLEQAEWRPVVPLPPIASAPRQQVVIPLLFYLGAGAGIATLILLLLRYVTGSLW